MNLLFFFSIKNDSYFLFFLVEFLFNLSRVQIMTNEFVGRKIKYLMHLHQWSLWNILENIESELRIESIERSLSSLK